MFLVQEVERLRGGKEEKGEKEVEEVEERRGMRRSSPDGREGEVREGSA